MNFAFLLFLFQVATLPEDWHSCYKALSDDSSVDICIEIYLFGVLIPTTFEDSESYYPSKIGNNNCKSELHCNDQFPLTNKDQIKFINSSID